MPQGCKLFNSCLGFIFNESKLIFLYQFTTSNYHTTTLFIYWQVLFSTFFLEGQPIYGFIL